MRWSQPFGSGPAVLPELTLGRLLSVVGAGALELSLAPEGLEAVVRGVTVLDVLEPGMPPGQVVLVVGVDPQSAAAADVVRGVGSSGAVAVVFGPDRSGRAAGALRAAAEEAGTAVLFRTAWFGWAQLVGVLRAGLASADVPADPWVAGVALGDMDGLADAVAALVGGAVTIEDMESRVLAYSSTEEDVDELRRMTILGRRVPPGRVAAMQEAGFFRALWGAGDVVRRPAEGTVPERLVIAVSAGGEILGSIWVAAASRPLPPHAADALRAAARAAAPHLIHHRSRGEAHARLVEDAARGLLEGRGSAEVLAERAALPADSRCAVLSVHVKGAGEHELARLPGLLALTCTALGYRAVVLPTTDGSLVLLAGLEKAAQRADAQVSRLGESLVPQLSEVFGAGVRIGLGEVAGGLAQLPESRRSADLALRALLTAGGARAVGRARDLAQAVAMVRLMDALRELELPPDTPVARLVAYDAGHGGGSMVDTLRAYLDHFGDVPATSRALGVHVNSLRYRIRRLGEVSGIDLGSPDARLLAQVQLRLLDRDLCDGT